MGKRMEIKMTDSYVKLKKVDENYIFTPKNLAEIFSKALCLIWQIIPFSRTNKRRNAGKNMSGLLKTPSY